MKTPRVIVLSFIFFTFNLYLSAQRMGTGPQSSQSPFSNQVAQAGMNARGNPGHGDSRSLSGVVQDTQNHGLKDVRVEVTDPNGSPVGSAYTNAAGRFEFNNLPSGTYTVV